MRKYKLGYEEMNSSKEEEWEKVAHTVYSESALGLHVTHPVDGLTAIATAISDVSFAENQ